MSDYLLVHGGFGGGWLWERPRPISRSWPTRLPTNGRQASQLDGPLRSERSPIAALVIELLEGDQAPALP